MEASLLSESLSESRIQSLSELCKRLKDLRSLHLEEGDVMLSVSNLHQKTGEMITSVSKYHEQIGGVLKDFMDDFIEELQDTAEIDIERLSDFSKRVYYLMGEVFEAHYTLTKEMDTILSMLRVKCKCGEEVSPDRCHLHKCDHSGSSDLSSTVVRSPLKENLMQKFSEFLEDSPMELMYELKNTFGESSPPEISSNIGTQEEILNLQKQLFLVTQERDRLKVCNSKLIEGISELQNLSLEIQEPKAQASSEVSLEIQEHEVSGDHEPWVDPIAESLCQ